MHGATSKTPRMGLDAFSKGRRHTVSKKPYDTVHLREKVLLFALKAT